MKKAIKIDDGLHEGAITGIEYRQKPYEYVDVVIDMQGMTLKSGYPACMMEDSKLGLLMKRFGIIVAEGLKVIPEDIIGRAVQFLTQNKPGKQGGNYANIIPDSVRPHSGIINQSQQVAPAQPATNTAGQTGMVEVRHQTG